MIARVVATLVVGLVVSAAACVDDVSFASVELTVREPQDQERFGSPALTGLQWTIDKKFRASVSFDPSSPAQTLDINLGQTARDLDVLVFVGDKDNPQAIGRARPLTIPALDQRSLEPAPPQEAEVFLAQPYVPELLVANTPDVRIGTAACDSSAGKALVVGGADNAYVLGGGLTVTEIVRDYNTIGRTVACDITDEDNSAVAVRGECSGEGAGDYELTIGLGSGNDTVVPTQEGELCNPFVRVAGDVIWVAGASFVTLHERTTGIRIDRAALPLTSPVRHALVDDGTLIVQGRLATGSQATFIVRRIGAAIQDGVPVALDRFLAADPSGPSMFFADGSVRVPVIGADDQGAAVVLFTSERAAGLTIDPVHIVVISANDENPRRQRVVGLDATGLLQIEGEAEIATGRESMAVTFGGALLLFGGAQGHDVLVAPLSAFERAALPPPPEDGAY